MPIDGTQYGFHYNQDAKQNAAPKQDTQFTYTFENFFHPFVGELISKLNQDVLPGMMAGQLDPALNQGSLFFDTAYPQPAGKLVQRVSFANKIEVDANKPYASYNWELFFHIPLAIAVLLSKNQRFAESQRWFHYIFDPTSNDLTVNPPMRFWKFLAFREDVDPKQLDYLLTLLSKSPKELSGDEPQRRADILNSYQATLNKPFQPYAVARTRHLAYQYCVVMKYLDNIIGWADNQFQQYTAESLTEATLLYVLAANILGPRPERIPPRGTVQPKTFAQLKALKAPGLDAMGNAMVELEGQFPFNLGSPAPEGNGGGAAPLFGIGRTLYFCIPRNERLLGYWDVVADRLFKIRHCRTIEGVVRPLALFDPPLDPGMLVKAAAAGIDIASIVSGLNQPVGPVRCLTLIQKALELCGEVRGLGSALLSALEKGDGEHLALVRQRHEIQIQQMTQEVRFLQWKSAQEATQALLAGRGSALERLHYYQRQLNLTATDPNAWETLTDNGSLTEENFDEAYQTLVGQYAQPIALQKLPDLKIVPDASSEPAGAAGLAGLDRSAQRATDALTFIPLPGADAISQLTKGTGVYNSAGEPAGASGQGKLFLNTNEDADLNIHGPQARVARLTSMAIDTLYGPLALLPSINVDVAFWGIGAHSTVFGGPMLAAYGHFLSSVANMVATEEEGQAIRASKAAGYERRADEWMLQYNLAAHELMQNGRQILTSLIAEQIAHHEYLSVQQQIANAREVDQFLHDKFTNEELYLWMQGEISRLYYEYYRFAFDTAGKAERTMKQELMRPELDAQDFVKFNYWDGGRKGLLSGEALHLDVKRMEMAYYDNNKRELELTRHVSLRQLDPVALLNLRVTGSCEVSIPEWFYDRDCPGHYMRRIKTVAVSLPSVVGPYTSVNCTLSLLRSSIRKSPALKDDAYARTGADDDRFVDYSGSVQQVVTSGGSNDTGMFAETSSRDDRFYPFEGAGAVSVWTLELPVDLRPFDYMTISDVLLHIRYTSRQGTDTLAQKAVESMRNILGTADQSGLALLFFLRYDFPTEWSAFVNGNSGFSVRLRKEYFPYMVQSEKLSIEADLELYHASNGKPIKVPPGKLAGDLNGNGYSDVLLDRNAVLVVDKGAPEPAFLIVRYSF